MHYNKIVFQFFFIFTIGFALALVINVKILNIEINFFNFFQFWNNF